jgi:hypothetical protein
MRRAVDAFIERVETARRELIKQTGQNVSVRELLRRAGYTDNQRASIAYHLNPNRHTGDKPHHVPPELVRRLAAVFRALGNPPPVDEDQLAQAARVAAGFDVVDTSSPNVPDMVQRFYGDENVTDEQKRAVTRQLMKILAEEIARISQPVDEAWDDG